MSNSDNFINNIETDENCKELKEMLAKYDKHKVKELTVKQLKKELTVVGQKKTGKKAELVARLTQYFDSVENSEPPKKRRKLNYNGDRV